MTGQTTPEERVMLARATLEVVRNRVSAAWSTVQAMKNDDDLEHTVTGPLFLLDDALGTIHEDVETAINELEGKSA